MPTELTVTLSTLAGIILSAFFRYVPYVSAKYDTLGSELKSLVMLGCLIVASLLVWSASCYDFYQVVACTDEGAHTLVLAFAIALATNQSTYQMIKRHDS